jgi:hypothetical protein
MECSFPISAKYLLKSLLNTSITSSICPFATCPTTYSLLGVQKLLCQKQRASKKGEEEERVGMASGFLTILKPILPCFKLKEVSTGT